MATVFEELSAAEAKLRQQVLEHATISQARDNSFRGTIVDSAYQKVIINLEWSIAATLDRVNRLEAEVAEQLED